MTLTFLSYTSIKDIPQDELFIIATDLALAALSGENVYNFGEFVMHPLLQILKGTPNAWIHDLVIALNKGNIDEFNSIIFANRDNYNQRFGNSDVVKQKVVLLALINMAFERSSNDRNISFNEIAIHTRLPLDQVYYIFYLTIIK